jgi:hypothetical protein
MKALKPKEQHERLQAAADCEKIVQFLGQGREEDIAGIAVKLARQCDLFIHFQRLWLMRVGELDGKLSSDRYTKNIYENRRTLYKELFKSGSA